MSRFTKCSGREVLKGHLRLPSWIVKKPVRLNELHTMKTELRNSALHTVCEEARCPNRTHCFQSGTATFLIMGNICTRACGFCSIQSGKPLVLNPLEPNEIAQRISAMKLHFAVLTSVNRDDLADGGAKHFAQTIRAIHDLTPNVGIEVLTPDFMGNMESVAEVVSAGPTVFNHNVETVPRLYSTVRPAGKFSRTLAVLTEAKRLGLNLFGPDFRTKSGLMLGLGETEAELTEVCSELVQAGVDVLTLGQYLRPTRYQIPVVRYIHPDEFAELGAKIKNLGFRAVYAGPTVRSSFNAFEISNAEGVCVTDF
jgi:lipoic acid synthetase